MSILPSEWLTLIVSLQFLAVTTDNAADNGTMLASLSDFHRPLGVVYNPKDVWSRCVGHVLNLVAQGILKGLGALPPSEEEQDRVEALVDDANLDLEPEDDTNLEDDETEVVGSSAASSYSVSSAPTLASLPAPTQPLTYFHPQQVPATIFLPPPTRPSTLTHIPAPVVVPAPGNKKKNKKPPTATQVALNKVCHSFCLNSTNFFSDKCRAIGRRLRKSPLQWGRFEDVAKEVQPEIKVHKIKRDQATRWNSTHAMIKSFILMKKVGLHFTYPVY